MFHNVLAPKSGPLLCIGDKPYYVYADKSTVSVPVSTVDMIEITPLEATRIVCTCDHVIANPIDIQDNLLSSVKIVAKLQPIVYKEYTFYIQEMEPKEECLLLKPDTILEIVCSWTRIIMDVELFSHAPILHLYIGLCDMIWPFDNIFKIQCSYFLKDMDLKTRVEECLQYQPCILLLENIDYLEDLWPHVMIEFVKFTDKAVIIAAQTNKDIKDVPGLWITRHFSPIDAVKQDKLQKLNFEFNTKLELDLNEIEITKMKEKAWRHKLKDIQETVDNSATLIGLHNIMDSLDKVIMRPLKYKKLYSSLPNLSKGVLLYGLPGTGKSFIAKYFLKSAKIPYKVIKGPEILSKYVGETERNVRELFQEAQSKAPYVLLFDDIDALTPKRGNDTSGITDRIVNQFLTALDGSDILENVFVIGTTSQPQTLDPALLRPGRLDTHVECKCLDPEEFELAASHLCQKYQFKSITYEYCENCTFGDLESSFLRIYFEHVAKHGSNENIQSQTIDFKSSFSENTLNNYKHHLDEFKGKRKGIRQRQTLA